MCVCVCVRARARVCVCVFARQRALAFVPFSDKKKSIIDFFLIEYVLVTFLKIGFYVKISK